MLGKWYHIAYSVSDTEKRLEVYVNGEWRAFAAIVNVRTEQVIFNEGPLYIGRDYSWDSFIGEIRYILLMLTRSNTTDLS